MRTTVIFPKQLADRLHQAVVKTGLTQSEIFRAALNAYLRAQGL